MDKVILFDNSCDLCRSLISYILLAAGKKNIRIIPLMSEKGKELLKSIGMQSCKVDTVVYYSSGKVFTKSSAVLGILKELGGLWRIFLVFGAFPRVFRDFVYDLIAGSRFYFTGTKRRCAVND